MPAIEFFFTNRPGACFYQPLSVSNSRVHCVPVTEQVHPSTSCSLASRGPSLVAIPAELPPDTFPHERFAVPGRHGGAFPRIYAPISERHANGFAGCSTTLKPYFFGMLMSNIPFIKLDMPRTLECARGGKEIGDLQLWKRNADVGHSMYRPECAVHIEKNGRRKRHWQPTSVNVKM